MEAGALVMVRAIVRPEKAQAVMEALTAAGFPAVTRIEVFGRGKQRGLKLGAVTYDELPKEMLLVVVPAADQERLVATIRAAARTDPHGAPGDGKVFVTPVAAMYTISSGRREG
jgi:nitrogen regulatory protein PII 1